MNRREAMAQVSALALVSFMHTPASAYTNHGGDWSVFSALGVCIEQIRASTDPIANHITKARFLWFLNRIQLTLFDLEEQKRIIRQTLSRANCVGDAVTVTELAGEAADRIKPLLTQLSDQIRELVPAIKPAGSRSLATQLVANMVTLRDSKLWIHHVPHYCHLPMEDRAPFVAEVKASVGYVADARTKLNALMDLIGST